MNKRDEIIPTIFALSVALSVGITFYRYIIQEDIDFYIDEKAFQESLLEE